MKFAVLTSGGDAPGMNGAISGVVRAALARGHAVLGIRDGYTGLLERAVQTLDLPAVTGIAKYGGTVLGSAREPRMRCLDGVLEARAALDELGVDGLVVIGGNGSLAGAHAVAGSRCKVLGLAASIDNDVGHTRMCIGVDTAINTIVEACDRITDTATAHRRVFVVEVMGRKSGFLAMRAGLAAEAEVILQAESAQPREEVMAHIRSVIRKAFSPERAKRRVLVIRAEGARVSTPELVEGIRRILPEEAPGVSVRETVLGHLVRGGRPSQADRVMAQRLGFGAVLALESGLDDVMLGWDVPGDHGASTSDNRVRAVGLESVLEETQRLLDGTSPVAAARLALLQKAEGILAV